MSAALSLPPIGHNLPHVDLKAALEPETLKLWLDTEFEPFAARRDELLAARERFDAQHPEIRDDDACGRAADFVRQLDAAIKATDALRKLVKDPVLHAQRLIDGTGNGICRALESAKDGVEAKITAHQARKAAAARAEAEAQAKRLAEQAARLAAEAEQASVPEVMDAAIAASAAADAAAERAASGPSELVRFSTSLGTSVSMRRKLCVRVIDIKKVRPELLMLNEAAALALYRAGGKAEPGLEFYFEEKADIR
jgi:hypothetical protein